MVARRCLTIVRPGLVSRYSAGDAPASAGWGADNHLPSHAPAWNSAGLPDVRTMRSTWSINSITDRILSLSGAEYRVADFPWLRGFDRSNSRTSTAFGMSTASANRSTTSACNPVRIILTSSVAGALRIALMLENIGGVQHWSDQHHARELGPIREFPDGDLSRRPEDLDRIERFWLRTVAVFAHLSFPHRTDL